MKKILKNCGYIVLIAQIIMIFIMNLILSSTNIDCDSAKLFVHAIEMSKNGTFLISGWEYASTLELDCSLLLAVPIFNVIKNIYVSFSIANMLFLLLLIWTVFRLFGDENREGAILGSIFICIPYRIGMLDYMNMLFFNGSQYIVKVTLPLMLLSMLLYPFDCKNKNKWYRIGNGFYTLIFIIMLFIAGFSSGVYSIFCGLFPVMAGVFFWRLYNAKSIGIHFWFYSGLTMLMSAIGIVTNAAMKLGAKGNGMTLCNIYGELQDNIRACFWGIFEVFGGVSYASIEVMSYEGINILSRMFFVIILLICAVVAANKMIHKTAIERDVALLAVFVWNTFVLCIINTRYGAGTYEYRYHLIGVIPLICLSVSVLQQFYRVWTRNIKIGGMVIVTMVVAFLSITSYKTVWDSRNDYTNLQEVCDYAKELTCEYVYYMYDSISPEVSRLLDYEGIIYLMGMSDDMSYVCDYYSKYHEAPIIYENALFVIDNSMGDLQDTIEMQGRILERCNIIGTKSIYYDTGQ